MRMLYFRPVWFIEVEKVSGGMGSCAENNVEFNVQLCVLNCLSAK